MPVLIDTLNCLATNRRSDVTNMNLPDNLLTVFSAELEERGGTPVIVLPEREFRAGELAVGDTYRVAVLSSPATGTGSTGGDATPDRRRRAHKEPEPPVEEGDLCEVEIEDFGEQGDGIARVGPGYIVFVPDTQVGDRVTIEITQARDNFAFAEVVEDEPVTG